MRWMYILLSFLLEDYISLHDEQIRILIFSIDRIRAGQVPLEQFIVTKGLNKNPKDYPDCKGQVKNNNNDNIVKCVCLRCAYRDCESVRAAAFFFSCSIDCICFLSTHYLISYI